MEITLEKTLAVMIETWVKRSDQEYEFDGYIECEYINARVRWGHLIGPHYTSKVKTMEVAHVEVKEEYRNQRVFTRFIAEWERIAIRETRCVVVNIACKDYVYQTMESRGYRVYKNKMWKRNI